MFLCLHLENIINDQITLNERSVNITGKNFVIDKSLIINLSYYLNFSLYSYTLGCSSNSFMG